MCGGTPDCRMRNLAATLPTCNSVRGLGVEEFCCVRNEVAGVLEQKSVGGIGINFDPRLRNETGQQIGKVWQDHWVAVTRSDEHRMIDRADPLQRCVIRDTP